MPNRYLKTKPKYGHDEKIFFGLNKVFQKHWNSFRKLSRVSMKYCSMRKQKEFALPKDQERNDSA